MAVADQLASEYRVLREACGLLDRSERGKLALTGAEAAEFLNGQVSNEVLTLEPGQGCYAALLTPKGKMLADLRIVAVPESDDHELWLDTERSALQSLFDSLRRHLVGFRAELHKRTLAQGLLSLIGPEASSLFDAPPPATEHVSRRSTLAKRSVLLIRTDVGIDVVCDAADTPVLASALRGAGAVTVSEEAAECLRIEDGRPRYGLDLDDSTIPQEAALNDRAVSFTKGCYVGQETVARLYYRGKPNRQLRGLLLSGPARTGQELRLDGRNVGRLGSVALSPALGPIALAIVRREVETGAALDVGSEGLIANVVDLPFALPG